MFSLSAKVPDGLTILPHCQQFTRIRRVLVSEPGFRSELWIMELKMEIKSSVPFGLFLLLFFVMDFLIHSTGEMVIMEFTYIR